MFRMQVWQWVVVGATAVACVGVMAWTVGRMFAQRADSAAVLRQSTAFESAATSGTAPAGSVAYDVWGYRVPARVMGRARIVIVDGRVSVAGPRVASGLYQVWIWLQALILALVPAAAVAALVGFDWRWLLAAVGVLLLWFVVGCLGAVAWPGMGELGWLDAGRFEAVEFASASVSDVKVGEGWADGGIGLVQLPIKAGIDAMSTGHAVSFYAPDDEGRKVRYALHLTDPAHADALAEALRSGGR